MKLTVLIFVLSGLATQVAFGQTMISALHRDALHLVQDVTDSEVVVLMDGERVRLPLARARMIVSESPGYLPGFIGIENENLVVSDFDETNRDIMNTFVFRYEAEITPIRDVINGFIVVEWRRSDRSNFLAALPLQDLEEGKKHTVRYRIYVSDRFRHVDPMVRYYSMGLEMGTSKVMDKPMTPYEEILADHGGSSLPDGNLAPIFMIPNTPIHDEQGNRREGMVHLRMDVDTNGYVVSIHPVKYTEWIFAKACQLTAPYFLFQPKIENGQPVATSVVVPFRF